MKCYQKVWKGEKFSIELLSCSEFHLDLYLDLSNAGSLLFFPILQQGLKSLSF